MFKVDLKQVNAMKMFSHRPLSFSVGVMNVARVEKGGITSPDLHCPYVLVVVTELGPLVVSSSINTLLYQGHYI
jgi:hypothetical protein